MIFCIRLPNFIQIGWYTAETWRRVNFSRWRPWPLNTTSGFLLVDATVLGRLKSISKPNLIDISIRGWDITTSVLEKQASTILELYFQFRFRLYHRNWHAVLHQAAKFHSNGAPAAEIWRNINFSRWWTWQLNTTSGFVFVDVTAFRRSKSIRKPNFVKPRFQGDAII